MLSAIFWGVCLRIVQAALQASPFIFTGLCITGLLHRLMGQQHTRQLFGSNSIASLFQSWLIGMLLPGCSLGVIPIVKQLRRSGIAVGTIFAFALSKSAWRSVACARMCPLSRCRRPCRPRP